MQIHIQIHTTYTLLTLIHTQNHTYYIYHTYINPHIKPQIPHATYTHIHTLYGRIKYKNQKGPDFTYC